MDIIFPAMLFLWLLGYLLVHLRRLIVTKCARMFETDQLVHWAIIWTGFGGLSFRGLALYKLFEMSDAFVAGSAWPPPYLAGLTLAVRSLHGCNQTCHRLQPRVPRLQLHVPR